MMAFWAAGTARAARRARPATGIRNNGICLCFPIYGETACFSLAVWRMFSAAAAHTGCKPNQGGTE